MIIRTFQKQSKVKHIALILLLIFITIFIFRKWGTYLYTRMTSIPSTGEVVLIGQEINKIGGIQAENGFPIYTHKFVDTEGNTYFLKSYSINLNKYKGDIEFKGKVKEIYKDTPVIEVDTIKVPEQSLIIKGNTYFFIKNLLYLDFSAQQQLSAQEEENEMQILFNNKKLFSIERILCSKVLKSKWCDNLIQEYTQNQRENFDSYRWYTFYKQSKWFRTSFDNNTFLYVFKNIDDDTILNISSAMRVIDKNFILNNKRENIRTACTGTGNEIMKNISINTLEYEENNKLISIITEGQTNKKHDMICRVTFDMWNDRKILDTKITIQ